MYINSLMLKIVFSFFLIVLSFGSAFAEAINSIEVKGNKRVSKETIINFSELKVGQEFSDEMLNNSLKELYNSKFFEDVSLEMNNGTLIINVKELPIIQEIIINGIKANKTIEELKEIISLKEKNPFDPNTILNDVNKILNAFKRSGFYFAKVNTKIENNSNETVNIIFDINRGDKATISEIKFIGNKKIKDRKLFNVITSEVDKPWKFISNKKYLNVERINLDKRLLKNYYLEKGYYEIKVQDAYSQLIDEKDFILTFNIDAGEKFYFGAVLSNSVDDMLVIPFFEIEFSITGIIFSVIFSVCEFPLLSLLMKFL